MAPISPGVEIAPVEAGWKKGGEWPALKGRSESGEPLRVVLYMVRVGFSYS